MPTERRFLAWVQFEGTDFSGFARQKDRRTVQGELEAAWLRWRSESIRIPSSSRTDAGVHARRMPLLIVTAANIPPRAVRHGLNSELAPDLAIQAAERVDESFHVRHDCIGKRYVYRIWSSPLRAPLRRLDHWHVPRPLHVERMRAAGQAYVGSHDFAAFRSAHCQAKTTRRTISRVAVDVDGPAITVTIEGNAFLQNMVRIMVGTLVEIGWGRIGQDELPAVIASRDRLRAGQTAPACGLTLDDVFYGEFGGGEGLRYKIDASG